MPTYEYECPKCGVFEVFQNMTDERLKTCKICHRRKVKRLLGSGAGIIFKGTGFYQTDYRSSSFQSDAKTDQTVESKPGTDSTNSKVGTSSAQETSTSTSTANKPATKKRAKSK